LLSFFGTSDGTRFLRTGPRGSLGAALPLWQAAQPFRSAGAVSTVPCELFGVLRAFHTGPENVNVELPKDDGLFAFHVAAP
jgi:hypothetical protein